MPHSSSVLLVAASLLATALPAKEGGLVWHAETSGGEILSSHDGDRLVNPASVTKIATALFALERLGRDHRYETGFALEGELDPATGTLAGDLRVLGGHDPDFQFESARLVARRLAELGLRRVTGDLLVDDGFWMGWEHGAEGRESDPGRRLLEMGERLRRALDPELWDGEYQASWSAWRERDPDLPASPPRLVVAGRVVRASGVAGAPAVTHRSNPLDVILKRFLSYSNNDIERVAEPLGGAPALEAFLRESLRLAPGEVRLATSSGLGINRISPRAVVRLLRAFGDHLATYGLLPEDLLPMPGCDRGSLVRALPHWQAGERMGAMASKTGTLIRDDGGVAALAGFLYGKSDTVLFMVAAPRSGHRILEAQRDIESWANQMIERVSGPGSHPCGAPIQAVEWAAEAALARATLPMTH